MAPALTRLSLRGRGPARGLALAVASSLVLSGCAEGLGFDLNGKVFDWMGISASALQQRKEEPKLADRAPLVLPPDTSRLPAPGSGSSAPGPSAPGPSAPAQSTQNTQAAMAWPEDPDQRKAREAQERERLHLAYCRGEIQWKDRVLDSEGVNTPKSPFGPCPLLIGDVNTLIGK